MSVWDIILGGIILFGFIRGFMKGLFVEVASLIALLAGIYGAIHFSDFAANYLSQYVDWSRQTINISAFAITFVVIMFLVALAGKLFTRLANFAALGFLNKLLGAFFGAIKMAFILSILLIVFEKINDIATFSDEVNNENGSVLYSPVKKLAPSLFPSILNIEEVIEEKII